MPEIQLQLPFNKRRMILREQLTGHQTVKHLLRVLDDHAGDGTDCFLSNATLSREMSCVIRTVQRAVKTAQEEELIIVFPGGGRGKRRCNVYRIRRANLRDLAEAGKHARDAADAAFEGDYLSPLPRQIVTPTTTNSHPRGDLLSSPIRSCIEVSLKPPPPAPDKRTAPALSEEWRAVVVALLKFGVNDPEPAIENARQRGVTPSYVFELIAHAKSKPGAWGPGALRKRVFNAIPGEDVAALWTPENEAFTRVQRDAGAARRGEIEKQEIRDRQREIAEEDQALQALEDRHGPTLDAMEGPELDGLALSVFGEGTPAHRLYRRNGARSPSPMIRSVLLRELKRTVAVE